MEENRLSFYFSGEISLVEIQIVHGIETIGGEFLLGHVSLPVYRGKTCLTHREDIREATFVQKCAIRVPRKGIHFLCRKSPWLSMQPLYDRLDEMGSNTGLGAADAYKDT